MLRSARTGIEPQWVHSDPLTVSISRLSADDLSRMSRRDLVDVMRMSGLARPWDDTEELLQRVSDNRLRELVEFVRGCCRRNVERFGIHRQWPVGDFRSHRPR